MAKILIISLETWRDDQNGGNVLSNIFQGTDYEFAQIYCSPGTPSNQICKEYLQMTDRMAFQSIFTGHMGRRIHSQNLPGQEPVNGPLKPKNGKRYAFFRKFHLQIFQAAREILWELAYWDCEELDRFLDEFQPDYIFAPWYSKNYMLKIDRYVQQRCQCPMVSYVSDDNYSLKAKRFSVLYWANRLFLRSNARKTIGLCSKLFTMTQEQMEEYAPQFPCEMQILRKSGNFPDRCPDRQPGNPIRIIYAGGIYLNRWKVLEKIAKSLASINSSRSAGEPCMQLHIFTNGQLNRHQKKRLHDGRNVFLHQAVPSEILQKEYQKSDIALHVESFDRVNRSDTRLSFSTKITDCLQSGCAVLAVCPPQNAGYRYLKREHAAICIGRPEAVESALRYIQGNPQVIPKYAKKAWECGRRNHMPEQNERLIKNTFGKDMERADEPSEKESIAGRRF